MAEDRRGSAMVGAGGAGMMMGVLIGGVAGFIAGVLLAPKSGEETRSMLADRGKEWRDKAEELTVAAKDRLSSATAEGRRAAGRMRGSGDFEDLDLDDEKL